MQTTAADRRARVEAVGYDFASQRRQTVTACNLCGGSTFVVLTHRDRYEYPAEAHACADCGLVFLNPVMQAEAYAEFYARVYRPLVSAYHGRTIDARSIQPEQQKYAADLTSLLGPFVVGNGARALLDIGGSTGVVAQAVASAFGLDATVIDPAPPELDEARRRGLDVIAGFAEHHDLGGRRFDLVLVCQTVDHLLDIGSTLRRVRQLLTPEGLLFVDIVDFRAAYLRNWSVEEAVKIDHPYYLTEPVMRAYLTRAGFHVVRTDYAGDHLHIGYVCRGGEADERAVPPPETVGSLLREIRFVQNAPSQR
jgi:hypothetical protein